MKKTDQEIHHGGGEKQKINQKIHHEGTKITKKSDAGGARQANLILLPSLFFVSFVSSWWIF
jgi:hypothetical protein